MDKSKQHILVVDDDQGILDALQAMLEEVGYHVITANTPQSIHKIIKTHKPGLILLDIWMPGVDGQAITKDIKNKEATKHIPIILFSALNELDQLAKQAGADGFLRKPFNIDELLSLVKKHLKNAS